MDTKEKIIKAAAKEFASRGFREATMRSISKRAGINHAGINYHFKSKNDLYKDVMNYLFEHTSARISSGGEICSQEEWKQLIYGNALNLLSNITDPDEFERQKSAIFFREMVEPTEIFPFFYENYISRDISSLKRCMELGLPEESGDEEINFYTLFFISQCVFYEQNRIFVELMAGNDFFAKKNLERIASLVTENICGKLSFRDTQKI